MAPAAEDPEYPPFIEGQAEKYIPGRRSATHNYEARIEVRCPCDDHVGCARSRSLMLLRPSLGVRAAEVVLAVWVQAGHSLVAEKHRTYRPSVADMQSWLDSNP